ncbi:amino acid permease [Ectobacillus sp. JY-23]|uniref:APC family permease n=1 Tax=Ectobacillus sp. JY-23 TaxID=2933872 RepID=UPI001FF1D7DC|nr:amino acid permease [Ectobacillus sp. JY-23]UOY93358.1 amino acid permease [Ectobacillus sp. JY-23]
MNKKMGALLLSGLMIGPILGSGIIILPPAVYAIAGDYAIFAWVIMLALSMLFAHLFGKLSVMIPGDSGVALAVERAFGTHIKNLAAIFFALAVCFGPVAVMATAGHYFELLTNFNELWLTGICLLFVYLLLTQNVTAVGKLAFAMSSFIVITLFAGSAYTLLYTDGTLSLGSITVIEFGQSLLLLFWALIGWEVVGNYSLEVRDPERTLPRAILISFTVIASVSLIVAMAFQWGNHTMSGLLTGLFGSLATPLISTITIILCISTVLLVIGAVSRLIADQAKQGVLPKWLSHKNKKQVPARALTFMFIIHVCMFVLYAANIISISHLVAISNAFFLCNALLGVLACMRIFSSSFLKTGAAILVICFFSILLFSSPIILGVIALVCFYFIRLQRMTMKKKMPMQQ